MIASGIGIRKLRNLMARMLCEVGVDPADAEAVAWVYATMTLRGVGHHDVSGFPGLLGRLQGNVYNVRPDIRIVREHEAVAVMDGDNAPGPLAAYRATEAAIGKAGRFGIGMVSVRNSNHFMGAAPYALLAAERGMLGIVASNTMSCMGAPGCNDWVIGNNPWGFGVDTGGGFPLLLDICNAYASYGKLHEYKARGERIPREWGVDAQGRPTTSAARVLDGGTPMPMAGHKGFGIALLVELLTGVLSGGAVTDEVSLEPEEGNGSSQAAIVIDVRRFMPARQFRRRTRQMVEHIRSHTPIDPQAPIALPGERSQRARRAMQNEGVRLSEGTVRALNEWARRLGIRA